MLYLDFYNNNNTGNEKVEMQYNLTFFDSEGDVIHEQVISVHIDAQHKHTFPVLTLGDSLAVLDFKNIMTVTYNRKQSIKIYARQITNSLNDSKVFITINVIYEEYYLYSIDKIDKDGKLHKFNKYFFPETERNEDIRFNYDIIPLEFKALEQFKKDKYEFVSESFHSLLNYEFNNKDFKEKQSTLLFIEKNMNELFGFKNWIWETVTKDYIDFQVPFYLEQTQFFNLEDETI